MLTSTVQYYTNNMKEKLTTNIVFYLVYEKKNFKKAKHFYLAFT